MREQQVSRRKRNASLFATGDAGCGATEIPGCPAPHFDDDQYLALLHYKIEFTKAAAVVREQGGQTLAAKVFGRLLLRAPPDFLSRR